MSRATDRKKKQREERLRLEKHRSSIRSLYPAITFHNEHIVDKEFVNLIKEATSKIQFDIIRNDLPDHKEGIKEFLKNFQKYGFYHAYHLLSNDLLPEYVGLDRKAYSGWIVRKANQMVTVILWAVGDLIVQNYYDKIASFWPDQGFRLIYSDNAIGVVFQRMIRSHNAEGQLVFQHLASQKIDIKGKKYSICYTRHALDRMIDRFAEPLEHCDGNYYSRLVGIYDLLIYSKFKFVNGIKYKKDLGKAEPYLQFYFPMEIDIWAIQKDLEVDFSKLSNLAGENPYFDSSLKVTKPFQVYTTCVGCPCVIDESAGKVICITSLIPGHYPSPEHNIFFKKKVTNVKLQEDLRHRYFGSVHMKSDGYLEALKFFHENGYPQIFLEEPANKKNPLFVPYLYGYQSEIPDFLPSFERAL